MDGGTAGVPRRSTIDTGTRQGYLSRMTLLALRIPDDLAVALKVPVERLAEELALAAAVRLYEDGRVSLAKAAEVAGLDRSAFAEHLATLGLATATFDPGDLDAARNAAR